MCNVNGTWWTQLLSAPLGISCSTLKNMGGNHLMSHAISCLLADDA